MKCHRWAPCGWSTCGWPGVRICQTIQQIIVAMHLAGEGDTSPTLSHEERWCREISLKLCPVASRAKAGTWSAEACALCASPLAQLVWKLFICTRKRAVSWLVGKMLRALGIAQCWSDDSGQGTPWNNYPQESKSIQTLRPSWCIWFHNWVRMSGALAGKAQSAREGQPALWSSGPRRLWAMSASGISKQGVVTTQGESWLGKGTGYASQVLQVIFGCKINDIVEGKGEWGQHWQQDSSVLAELILN